MNMVIRCLNFGSLWWLRPGSEVSDSLRFSAHAAVFNTTGFVSGARERRLWLVAGVVRINIGMHRSLGSKEDYEGHCFDSRGPERRGEWNRLLLGPRLKATSKADRILFCLRSGVYGRVNFDRPWHDATLQVLAASAFRGEQETLILAGPGTQFQTNRGFWEVTWSDIVKRK
jgi:hypothetical protein